MTFDKPAMALQWAIFSFTPESGLLESKSTAHYLGMEIASNILLPLTTELALKGLKQGEIPDCEVLRTHDLLRLFRSLSPETRASLSTRFMEYVSDDSNIWPKPASLLAFLEEHRNDFVEWRYLEGELHGLNSAKSAFHYCICAVLDEVYSD